MAERIKEPRWIDWPNRDYQLKLEKVYEMGARCDAWRAFLNSETLKRLSRIKGYVIWFNEHRYFDEMYAEFDCTETALRKVLSQLIRGEFAGQPYQFIHDDIYDARAWAKLPLSWFTECDEREVPKLHFGLRLPRTVQQENFTLTHRLKHGRRFAEMTYNDRTIDRRFNGKRWVADKMFPREATRRQMYAELLAVVKTECAKHLVTINESPAEVQ